MTTKVVVHSNTKRLIQVVGLAVLLAAGLTGLKRFSIWWKSDETPIAASSADIVNPVASAAAIHAANSAGDDLIVGPSSIVDADTIQVQGRRIRLEGIDAPEASQLCTLGGQDWACGRKAATSLGSWLGNRQVSCVPKGRDRYNRTLARCFVGSDDIQSWLVINGWALAFREHSKDFVSAEEVAKSRKVGLWQGEFVAPWDWRKQKQ